jgi:putative transposase
LAWWPENSKCAYQEAFRDLDRALTDFIKSKKGERNVGGYVKAKLALAERIYHCERCGLVLDRDINAARNLLNLAASGAERLNGAMIRPGKAGCIPLNQEPGTAPTGKAGTAAGQLAAAGQELTQLTDAATVGSRCV